MINTKKHIFVSSVLLILIILLFEFTKLDITIQENFYNRDTFSWVLNKENSILKLLIYDGIKKVLILFAFSLLLILIFFRKKILLTYRRGMIIVVLSAIFVPLIVGSLKKTSNMPCPKNLIHFNGAYKDIKLFEKYPENFDKKKIKCWPAGHASGGFALLSLFFLFKKRKNQYIAISFALAIGFSMGTYKMLIGDHFFSHNLITMLIAWIVILIISLIIKEKNEKSTQI